MACNARAAGEERGLQCGEEEYGIAVSENATDQFCAKASMTRKGKTSLEKQSQKFSMSFYSPKQGPNFFFIEEFLDNLSQPQHHSINHASLQNLVHNFTPNATV